jgi:antitoxin ParD1/3/4
MSTNRSTLNISLTPELDKFVSTRVRSGRYLTASEVVREALRLLEEQEKIREMRLMELKGQIQLGLDQIKRNEIVDGEEVFRKIRGRINKHRNQKQ